MPSVKLTAVMVERIKAPTKGRLEIMDSIVTGLSLRVTEKGHKSWCVSYRVGSPTVRRLTLGPYPLLDLVKARDAARSALQLVERGIDPALARAEQARAEADRRKDTVEALVGRFITKYAKPKNRDWRNTERIFDRHVLPKWRNRPVDSISRKDVVQLLDSIVDKGFPSAANHTLAAVRKMFNWAAERGELESNPCLYIKPPSKVVERDRVLTDIELVAVWKAAEQMGYPFGTLVQMLLVTGQRREEVAQMRWEQIANNTWTLPRTRTKADRAHDVPLSSLAMAILSSIPRFTGPYVFTTTGGKKPVSGHSKAKARLDAKSGVRDWCIHDLRRTCGTGLARLGVPLATISRVLNHAEGGVTRIYARHSYLPEKREALEVWGIYVDKLTIKGGRNE
jgi:Site-specific recombinase XerD